MDDDIAEMLAASPTGGNVKCAVCRLLEEMTPEHRTAFDKGLDHPRINTTGILAWMKARGYVLDLVAPQKSLLTHKAHHRG